MKDETNSLIVVDADAFLSSLPKPTCFINCVVVFVRLCTVGVIGVITSYCSYFVLLALHVLCSF